MAHIKLPNVFYSLFWVYNIIRPPRVTPGENTDGISVLFESSRHRVDAVVTRSRTGRPGNPGWILGWGKRFSFSPKLSDRLWGPPCPSIQWAMGNPPLHPNP